MTKHAMVYFCLMSAAAATAHAQQPAVTALEQSVQSAIEAQILSKGVPSVSVAVMREGKLLMEGAWGRADVDKNLKASTSTVYPIGSVSKEFTAALVLKLVDRGRVSLTDPIGKHLQGLNAEFSGVTIDQLLNHTGGLPRDVRSPETRFESMTVDAMIKMTAGAKLAAQPGTAFGYSNAGYMLLGALVEKVYGKPYGAALHDEITKPLGLATLTRCGDQKPGEAKGYMLSPGKLEPPPGMHHSQLLGAGGICTTAADLVRWRHALHGGRVLSATSYTAMTTPRGPAVSGNYGFGLYARPAQWRDMAIVGGGQALSGHTAELHWYPGQSLAVALLYNAAPRVPGVADLVPRLVLGVPLAASAPAVTAQTSASFSGRWEGTVKMQRPDGTEGNSGPILFDLTQKGAELTGTAGPLGQEKPIEKGVVASGKATFQVQPGPLYKFTLTIVEGRLQGEMTGERDGIVGVRAKVDAAKATVAAVPQTSGGSPTTQNAQPQERKEITVAEGILKTYVGDYEINPDEILKITFENGSLWGEPPGATKRQMFAETETKFFLKSSPTEVTFQKDAKGTVTGLVMKRGTSPEVTFKKIK